MATIRINDNDGEHKSTYSQIYTSSEFCCVSSVHAGVRIGFDREVYSVQESDGTVSLVVRVRSGQLSDDVVVQLHTADRTAQGMYPLTTIS